MMGRWLARLVCGWRGHAWLRFFDHGRVALRCTRCGRETPGWRAHLPSLVPHARRLRT